MLTRFDYVGFDEVQSITFENPGQIQQALKHYMEFGEITTEEQISQFESENGVKLPQKYKEWLLFSDGGECFLPAGVQFYGVAHKPLIDVNEDDRPDDSYIVIGALASGDPVLCEKTGEKITIFDNETGSIDSELV